MTGLAVLFIAVLVTFLTIGRRETLTDLLLWIHTHQVAGFVLFGLLYVWFTGEVHSHGLCPINPVAVVELSMAWLTQSVAVALWLP